MPLSISRLLPVVLCAFSATPALGKLTWGQTKFLFTFGDSYTTDGFNISAGIDSPVPGFTSSNGPNWVQFLGGTFNVTNTRVFDLASGGATIDGALVPPYLPTVLSIVDQVSQFKQILGPKPANAAWQSSNSLFAFWIGINDVGNSFGWTNITGHEPQFYSKLMKRLESQLEILYDEDARSFLFLTVPPTDRSPLFLQQGPAVVARLRPLIANYNAQLASTVAQFKARHRDLDQVTVFDTQPVFNTLLDNAEALGFVNATGWCEAYQNGTPERTTQISPCAPVSSYFWLNSLHPLFTVHEILAHAISTTLSA
ncbi:putative carbohydrate esterase family 16 protein [Lyophyllum shimeji]|uniref:Carbohydrate esterase family 16 protein n=1 Tax=Lyophyllum shimeji TaxID=47721 RepID=A0A9P3PEL3_LYOSH|nr:putative carbohydrate esterase family 16 protein [Lyophyllum shimeji]